MIAVDAPRGGVLTPRPLMGFQPFSETCAAHWSSGAFAAIAVGSITAILADTVLCGSVRDASRWQGSSLTSL